MSYVFFFFFRFLTVPLLGLAMFPAAERNARDLGQGGPGGVGLQRDLHIGNAGAFGGKLSNHGIVLFIKIDKVVLIGLSIGKARGVAETEANKE